MLCITGGALLEEGEALLEDGEVLLLEDGDALLMKDEEGSLLEFEEGVVAGLLSSNFLFLDVARGTSRLRWTFGIFICIYL
jgi:hypothetical protein